MYESSNRGRPSAEFKLDDVDTYLYFEENAYWAGIMYESIQRESKAKQIQLVICTDTLLEKLDRHAGWIRSQGGFFVNWNGFKWLARFASLKIRHFRPSRILENQFKENQNVNVFRLPKEKKRFLLKVRKHHHTLQANPILSRYLIEEIVNSSLAEDGATEHIESYMNSKKIGKYMDSVRSLANTLDHLLENIHNADVIYMNGRTLHERVAFEICKVKDLGSYALEISANEARVQKFSGTAVNSEFYSEAIENFWSTFVEKNGLSLAELIGSEFFRMRRSNTKMNQFLRLFSNETEVSKDKEKQVTHFTFFTSSNEELKSLYSIYGGHQINQNEIILQLIEFFSEEQNMKKFLTIRVHPNTRRKRKLDKVFFDGLNSSRNVRIIDYSNGMNSYELIESSDVVMTAGSTVGLEAAYMGKPSLTFARTLWEGLNCSKLVKSVSDLRNVLEIDTHYSKSQALKYGLFMMEYGFELEYFDLARLRTKDSHSYFDQISRFKKSSQKH